MKKNSTNKKSFSLVIIFAILGLFFVIYKVVIPRYIKDNSIKSFRASQYVIDSQNAEDEFRKGLNKLIRNREQDLSYSSTKDFVKDLSRYMDIRMICNNNFDKCFGYNSFEYEGFKKNNISSLINPTSIGLNDNYLETVAFLTQKDRAYLVTYKKNCFLGYKQEETIPPCVAGIYDANRANKPNKFGVNTKDTGSDIKAFNGARIGDCAANINGLCVIATAFYPTPVSCNDVKDEFGIKTCVFNENNDYWAGALKQCKDIGGHLTTPEELAKIASALYGKEISPKENINKKFDKNIANALGFNFLYEIPSMWSSEEKNDKTAYIRSIKQDHSKWSDDERNQSVLTRAMCIKN